MGEHREKLTGRHKMQRRVLVATSNAGKLRDFAGAAAPYGIAIANVPHFASLPEVVEDGITGFLVSPDDIHTLADRLRKLLTDAGLRHRMGKEGKEKMQRQFSVERMVDRMNAVYQSALRHKDIV